jgi:transcriptional regulator with XRE-family HTH domain
MTTGELLKQQRLEKGLTLEAVALEAGTDPGNLSRIERDVQQPSAALLKRLAGALGLSPAVLYADGDGGTRVRESRPEYSKALQQLQRNFQALSKENQQLALDFIKMLSRRQKD